MERVVLVGAAAVLGGCIASFVNLVRWRVPRGESIVHPPSHCSACGHALRPHELVPVLSWVAQRGRCRHCHSAIPAAEVLGELVLAAVFAVVAFLLT